MMHIDAHRAPSQTSAPDGEAKRAVLGQLPGLAACTQPTVTRERVFDMCPSLFDGATFSELCERRQAANPSETPPQVTKAVETQIIARHRARAGRFADQFADWIRASHSTALQVAINELQLQLPDSSPKQVAAMAHKRLLKARNSAKHFWQTFIADSKMVDLMRDFGDPQARELVAAFIRSDVELTSKSAQERRLRTAEAKLYNTAAQSVADGALLDVEGGAPSATLRLTVAEQKTQSFLRAYTQSQSDPDSEVFGRVVEALVNSLERSMNAHSALSDQGAHSVCFGGAISMAECAVEPCADTFIDYLRHWREFVDTAKPGSEDVAAAVALRYAKRDEAVVESALVELTPADDCVTGNVDPLHSELLRNVLAVAEDEWFRSVASELHTKKRKTLDGRAKGNKAKRSKVDPALTSERLARSLPQLGPAYLRHFWRAPVGKERQCRNGGNCYCMVIAEKFPLVAQKRRGRTGFTCRELLLPAEEDLFRETGRLPSAHHFCFFCHLLIVALSQQEFVRRSKRPVGILNRFTVTTGPGAFDPRCMLAQTINGQFSGVAGSVLRLQANDFEYATAVVGAENVACLRSKSQLDFRSRSDM